MGVDLYPASWDAVEWAAAEAAASQKELRILHVIELTGAAAAGSDGFGLAYPTLPDADTEERARRTLAEATRRAQRVAPGLEVIVQLELGDPASVIARSGRRAALIALGGGSAPILAAEHKRSTSWRAARRATRPVALVDLAHRQTPGPLVGQVVVAVDPARESRTALEMAFRAAHQRGVGVAVAAPGQDTLSALRESFPDVDVTRLALDADTDGHSAPDLAGAAMLVVGSNSRWLHRAVFDCVGDRAVRAARGSTVLLT